MDWRDLHELLAAGKTAALELYNICVWAKTNAGMGSLYRLWKTAKTYTPNKLSARKE